MYVHRIIFPILDNAHTKFQILIFRSKEFKIKSECILHENQDIFLKRE